MTDIVDRIREEVRDWRCGPVVTEAADHIEELRRHIDNLLHQLEGRPVKHPQQSEQRAAARAAITVGAGNE